MSTTLITERRVLIDNQGVAKLAAQIVESEDGADKKLYAEGKIGHCDVPTANGRIYPTSIMRKEVDRLQQRIDESSLYAAVDHPGDGKSRIRDTGAIIRGLRIESDGTIWGKFQIIEETDHGRNLAAILKAGGAIGVSSRGLGSTRPHHESGKEIVGEDFRLVAFDFVLDPAVSTAYPKFFNESDEGLAEEIGVDDLRAKFPHLVRQIEESACNVASDTAVAALRQEMEADVERALKESKEELREQFKAELYPELVKDLKEDFAAKLVRATADMRSQVESVVRSELLADPEVAGAKLALENIAKIVVPFKPPVDVQKVIDEKDGEVSQLEQKLANLERKVDEALESKQVAEDHARKFGFRLYVAERVEGRTDAKTIKEMIGDVSGITDVEVLQQKVESAINAADQALHEAKKLVSVEDNEALRVEQKKAELAKAKATRIQRQHDALQEQIAALTERLEEGLAAKDRTISNLAQQNDTLNQRLQQAGQIAQRLEDQNYAATRLAGHPRRSELLGQIQKGEVRGRKRINQIAEQGDWNADQVGQESVRRFFGNGREFQTDQQRRTREVMTEGPGLGMGTPVPNMEHADITMEEIIQLSGGGHRRRK